jgi:hypothetical protein
VAPSNQSPECCDAKLPDLDFNSFTAFGSNHARFRGGCIWKDEQAIVRRCACLVEENCPESNKLSVQWLTTQMRPHDTKPNIHSPN